MNLYQFRSTANEDLFLLKSNASLHQIEQAVQDFKTIWLEDEEFLGFDEEVLGLIGYLRGQGLQVERVFAEEIII